MRKPERRTIILGLLLVASLALAACTRSASNNPVPTVDKPTDGGVIPPTAGAAEATMEAVKASILTQTAQAAQIGGGEDPTATEVPPVQPLAPTSTPAATSTPVLTATSATVTVPVTYTVQTGEWIYSIARKFGLDPNAIIAANPGINPNYVVAGQVLNLPRPGQTPAAPASTLARPTDYTVLKGDWIYSIARKFGVTPEQIIAANPSLTAPYTIYPGQVLHIP